MRYSLLVLLMLMPLIMLPMLHLPAAPAPEPAHAILDIGPPPNEKTAEEHCKDLIHRLTKPRGFIWYAGIQPEVGKLPSVARLNDVQPWLEKNIRITPERGGRRLRITFRAGTRAEQVTIINTLVRAYFREGVMSRIRFLEEVLRREEDRVVELEERIKSGQQPHMVDRYQNGINYLRINRIPASIAKIAQLKQVTVIKCAK